MCDLAKDVGQANEKILLKSTVSGATQKFW